MKPVQAIVLDATLLLLLGVWGYIVAPEDRATELISIVFSLLLFAALPLFRRDNLIVDFMLRVLLLLLTVALTLSLIRTIKTDAAGHAIRLGLLLLSTLYAFALLMCGYFQRRQKRRKERHDDGRQQTKRSGIQNKPLRDE